MWGAALSAGPPGATIPAWMGPCSSRTWRRGRASGPARGQVTAREMTEFAAQFDPQPFHLDDAAARGTLFGGLVGSGWHTAALTMRLLVDGFPVAGGIVGVGMDEVRWPTPLPPRRRAARRDRGAGGAALALAAERGAGQAARHHPPAGRAGGAGDRAQPDRAAPRGVTAPPAERRAPLYRSV